LILSTKTGADPHPRELPETTAQLKLAPNHVTPDGKVFRKTAVTDAAWADLFRGDEVGNADTP